LQCKKRIGTEYGSPDPLQLWRIIAQTHLVASIVNILLDRKEAKMIYKMIKQRYQVALVDYQLRFDRSIEALEQLAHHQMPDANDKVVHFSNILNDSKSSRVE